MDKKLDTDLERSNCQFCRGQVTFLKTLVVVVCPYMPHVVGKAGVPAPALSWKDCSFGLRRIVARILMRATRHLSHVAAVPCDYHPQ